MQGLLNNGFVRWFDNRLPVLSWTNEHLEPQLHTPVMELVRLVEEFTGEAARGGAVDRGVSAVAENFAH